MIDDQAQKAIIRLYRKNIHDKHTQHLKNISKRVERDITLEQQTDKDKQNHYIVKHEKTKNYVQDNIWPIKFPMFFYQFLGLTVPKHFFNLEKNKITSKLKIFRSIDEMINDKTDKNTYTKAVATVEQAQDIIKKGIYKPKYRDILDAAEIVEKKGIQQFRNYLTDHENTGVLVACHHLIKIDRNATNFGYKNDGKTDQIVHIDLNINEANFRQLFSNNIQTNEIIAKWKQLAKIGDPIAKKRLIEFYTTINKIAGMSESFILKVVDAISKDITTDKTNTISKIYLFLQHIKQFANTELEDSQEYGYTPINTQDYYKKVEDFMERAQYYYKIKTLIGIKIPQLYPKDYKIAKIARQPNKKQKTIKPGENNENETNNKHSSNNINFLDMMAMLGIKINPQQITKEPKTETNHNDTQSQTTGSTHTNRSINSSQKLDSKVHRPTFRINELEKPETDKSKNTKIQNKIQEYQNTAPKRTNSTSKNLSISLT